MSYDDFVHRLFAVLIRDAIDLVGPEDAAALINALVEYEAFPNRANTKALYMAAYSGATQLEQVAAIVGMACSKTPAGFDTLVGPWSRIAIGLVGDGLDTRERVTLRFVADGMPVLDAIEAAELILSSDPTVASSPGSAPG